MGSISSTGAGRWILCYYVTDYSDGKRRRKSKRMRDCSREEAEAELHKLVAENEIPRWATETKRREARVQATFKELSGATELGPQPVKPPSLSKRLPLNIPLHDAIKQIVIARIVGDTAKSAALDAVLVSHEAVPQEKHIATACDLLGVHDTELGKA